MKALLKIGHQGAAGYAPENTLKSFKKALEMNADMVEFDVHVCKTGELVIIHDEKLDRSTNGKGFVAHTSFNQLRKLDAGGREKIPTLEEVLDVINKKVQVNIELKGAKTAEPVSQIIKKYITEKDWSEDLFLVSSFNIYELLKFKELMPEIKIGALIKSRHINYESFIEYPLYSVNIIYKQVNADFIKEAHKRGLKVLVYTVDKQADIEEMKALGVDGIFTNYLDRI